jgi:hypothetical protein
MRASTMGQVAPAWNSRYGLALAGGGTILFTVWRAGHIVPVGRSIWHLDHVSDLTASHAQTVEMAADGLATQQSINIIAS